MATVQLNIGMEFGYHGADYVIVPERAMIPDTHEYLFHFLEADLGRLEGYAYSYLECIDYEHPENSTKADARTKQRLFEELFSLHPFYRSCPSAAAAAINTAMVQAVGCTLSKEVRSTMPEEAYVKLLSLVCIGDYLGGLDMAHWAEVAGAFPDATENRIFSELADLQKTMRRLVLLVFDCTNPTLAALSTRQRAAMYSAIFCDEYHPLLEAEFEKGFVKPRSLNALSAALNFDENTSLALFDAISELEKDPAGEILNALLGFVSAAQRAPEDSVLEVVHTDTLEKLLHYEAFQMIEHDMRVKRCKYCNRYFMLERINQEYCDRIAAGEQKPCNEIGKARTYVNRLASSGAMTLYRKAYKTHYARIKAGTMTRDEFMAWTAEAAATRARVENGELDIDEYAKWLKK